MRGGFPLTLQERVGRAVILSAEEIGALTIQFWEVLHKLPRVLPIVGTERGWRETVEQMLLIGVGALPLVGILSLCSGFILAFQGASELWRFGALEYVVNLVAIGFIRELAPLVTAIAVSGRSASSIAVEVGTMVAKKEVDAMRLMGLNPVEFTLAPKFLAAFITVPCLTVLSALCGIFAGYVLLFLSTDMSLRAYFQAAAEVILLRDVALAMAKSVVFAAIIVQIGCLEGLRVRGGPEGVGRSTTAAVVKSIFFVLLTDLIATTIFYLTGWSSAG
jgi:phospholipid/cholesterol/gamma-HCH transport system permease protein